MEDVLTEHPAVAQAYVAGLPDERMGEVGCAWAVPAAGGHPNPEELIAFCRERLARFKIPVHVFTVRPSTATGKVQKFGLIEQAREHLEAPA